MSTALLILASVLLIVATIFVNKWSNHLRALLNSLSVDDRSRQLPHLPLFKIEDDFEGVVDRPENLVVVMDSATVRGEILAGTVRIAGKMSGTVRATHWIEITSEASFSGDLSAPRVHIAEGADVTAAKIQLTGGT